MWICASFWISVWINVCDDRRMIIARKNQRGILRLLSIAIEHWLSDLGFFMFGASDSVGS